MASFRPDLAAALPAAPTSPSLGGPPMTMSDWATLAQAPQRPPGTLVTTRADDVHVLGVPTGPNGLLLHAQVDLANLSPDYGAGGRVISEPFLPGKTAADAVQPARAAAAQINASGAPFQAVRSNSNSVIGDFHARQYGARAGDNRTWGYDTGFAPPFVPVDATWP